MRSKLEIKVQNVKIYLFLLVTERERLTDTDESIEERMTWPRLNFAGLKTVVRESE
jgi:hypothetical protein